MAPNAIDSETEINVLYFSTNIEMSEDLYNFKFEKTLGKMFYICKKL